MFLNTGRDLKSSKDNAYNQLTALKNDQTFISDHSDLSSDFHDLNGDPYLAKATLDQVRKKSQKKQQRRRKSKAGAAGKEIAVEEPKEDIGIHM